MAWVGGWRRERGNRSVSSECREGEPPFLPAPGLLASMLASMLACYVMLLAQGVFGSVRGLA